jgi:hypothetical protein
VTYVHTIAHNEAGFGLVIALGLFCLAVVSFIGKKLPKRRRG